jgi:hypothetical protein
MRRAFLAVVILAMSAPAAAWADVLTIRGYRAPGTPKRYDRVQVRRFGSPQARRVLVLVPGTLAGAGDFTIVGRYLARHVPGLQVWAQMRREGPLEDDSRLLAGLRGKATIQQVFDYYLGWLADSSISPHYQPLDPRRFGFAKRWGLTVAMEDLRRVILRARDHGRRTVILGGHSLGGAETAIYAAWDFHGHAGYKDIAGMVGIDGGPFLRLGSHATTVAQARAQLAQMDRNGPWLDLLGFGLPWVSGAFSEVGALAAVKAPHAASTQQQFPLLPPALRPPVPATNQAQLGYAFDAATSPAALALIHVHSGHLGTGNPADWVNDGPTPIQNVARTFAQEPLGGVDWYYPLRLTIDVGAASSLTRTPAARFLGLRLRHRRQVNLPYYVIATSLGGRRLIAGARRFLHRSHIPSLTFVDASRSYGHLDPLLAAPARNAFLNTVVPWLRKIHAPPAFAAACACSSPPSPSASR